MARSKRYYRKKQSIRRKNIALKRLYGEERGTGPYSVIMGKGQSWTHPTLKTRKYTRRPSFDYKVKRVYNTVMNRSAHRKARRALKYGYDKYKKTKNITKSRKVVDKYIKKYDSIANKSKNYKTRRTFRAASSIINNVLGAAYKKKR